MVGEPASTAAEGSAGPFGLPAGWWPLGHSAEITGQPRAVQLGARPVAVYRGAAGDVHVLADRCPHRRLPLSMGRVTNNGLQCGYHGWTFDGAGRCTLIPNFKPGEQPSARIRVDAYPAADADGFVFVWTGGDNPSSAIGPVPRHDPASRGSGGATVRGTAMVRSPYQQVVAAVLANPGASLGLGALFGAGDEVLGPELMPGGGDHAVTVRRERHTLRLHRVSTFDPPFDRRTTSVLVTTTVATGTTEVLADGPGGGTFRAVIGVTPAGPYRAAVRWRVWAHGGLARALLTLGRPVAAGKRLTGQVASALETTADVIQAASDPALDRLRELRDRLPDSEGPEPERRAR
jgi:nitrite reductase/ring-hydroxylating ferredoxin subunit